MISCEEHKRRLIENLEPDSSLKKIKKGSLKLVWFSPNELGSVCILVLPFIILVHGWIGFHRRSGSGSNNYGWKPTLYVTNICTEVGKRKSIYVQTEL